MLILWIGNATLFALALVSELMLQLQFVFQTVHILIEILEYTRHMPQEDIVFLIVQAGHGQIQQHLHVFHHVQAPLL